MRLENIPVTSSGKIDRKALPDGVFIGEQAMLLLVMSAKGSWLQSGPNYWMFHGLEFMIISLDREEFAAGYAFCKRCTAQVEGRAECKGFICLPDH